ncbi:unnamed protein product [Amoebophrya sp. A120]|nr:unnamed protein product [Amoebophrya sp. A120]|eukprot:GSA120T00016893001.1
MFGTTPERPRRGRTAPLSPPTSELAESVTVLFDKTGDMSVRNSQAEQDGGEGSSSPIFSGRAGPSGGRIKTPPGQSSTDKNAHVMLLQSVTSPSRFRQGVVGTSCSDVVERGPHGEDSPLRTAASYGKTTTLLEFRQSANSCRSSGSCEGGGEPRRGRPSSFITKYASAPSCLNEQDLTLTTSTGEGVHGLSPVASRSTAARKLAWQDEPEPVLGRSSGPRGNGSIPTSGPSSCSSGVNSHKHQTTNDSGPYQSTTTSSSSSRKTSVVHDHAKGQQNSKNPATSYNTLMGGEDGSCRTNYGEHQYLGSCTTRALHRAGAASSPVRKMNYGVKLPSPTSLKRDPLQVVDDPRASFDDDDGTTSYPPTCPGGGASSASPPDLVLEDATSLEGCISPELSTRFPRCTVSCVSLASSCASDNFTEFSLEESQFFPMGSGATTGGHSNCGGDVQVQQVVDHGSPHESTTSSSDGSEQSLSPGKPKFSLRPAPFGGVPVSEDATELLLSSSIELIPNADNRDFKFPDSPVARTGITEEFHRLCSVDRKLQQICEDEVLTRPKCCALSVERHPHKFSGSNKCEEARRSAPQAQTNTGMQQENGNLLVRRSCGNNVERVTRSRRNTNAAASKMRFRACSLSSHAVAICMGGTSPIPSKSRLREYETIHAARLDAMCTGEGSVKSYLESLVAKVHRRYIETSRDSNATTTAGTDFASTTASSSLQSVWGKDS